MLKGFLVYLVSFCTFFSFANVVQSSPLLEGLTPYKTNNYRLFNIHGSNTVGANLGPELVKSFLAQEGAVRIKHIPGEKENEQIIHGAVYKDNLPYNVEVFIAAHGSSTGFKGLVSGKADVAASSRPIKKKEEVKLIHAGDMRSTNNEHIIAIDGLAIIVHPNNPITQLKTDQIKAIFTGKVRNWADLGGRDAPIKVLARDDKSGTFDTFKGLVLRKSKLIWSASRFESNDEISRIVTSTPNAIGFVALASIGRSKPIQVSDGDALALDPNKLTVATEDYPLSRRLFFYSTDIESKPAVKRFLDYVKTNNGQAVVNTTGFIAQSLFPLKITEENPWQRLNMNIRFKDGSSTLDNKASVDVTRLVEFLQQPENQYMQVKLVGYSNPTDTNSRADAISRIRAQNVRWALRSNGLSNKVKTEAGNLVSVADPESINGDKNRRVEVWVQ